LNSAVTELSQGRLAFARLLEDVRFERVQAPPEDDLFPAWLRGE